MAKKFRRILSLVLVFVMMMSMSTTALAAGAVVDGHTDACYAKNLICEQEGVQELICTTAEHSHDEGCAHAHTDACMSMMVDSAKCTAEEHSHTDACYHEHTGDCSNTCAIDTTVCQLSACTAEAHTHSADCMTCETSEHSHNDGCEEGCAIVEHTHSEACCGKAAHEHTDACHFHGEACVYHTHDDNCSGLICGKSEGELDCGKEEHAHTDDCKSLMVNCSKEYDCEVEAHTHGDDCYAEHVHGDACYERGDLICNHAEIPDDLDAVTSEESGITFNLYNYNSKINLSVDVDGKVTNKALYTLLSKYFNFNGSGETNGQSEDKSVVGQLGPGHFTYEINLGEDGAPIITWASVDNKEELESDDSRSIGYAFGTEEHYGVTAYENILTIPLVYNSETGYYEYDSADNAVDFDLEDYMVYIRGYVDQGKASADANKHFDEDDKLADFFPFNSRIQEDENGNITFVEDSESYVSGDTYYHYDTSNATDPERPDYWFGASMSATFYQPKEGSLDGNSMVYEFTGDDDVLVYIDGILAMDLGGAHSRASGSIDFATGLVETWLDAANQTNLYDSTYDHKEWAAEAAANGTLVKGEDGYYYGKNEDDGTELLIRYYPTTLYDSYKAAYAEQGMTEDEIEAKLAEMFVPVLNQETGEQEVVVDAYGVEHLAYRFNDYSMHDFDWFYMERHAWEANLSTKFNLATIPEYSLTIEKVVEGMEEVIEDAVYAFEVWATNEDGTESDLIETVELKAGERVTINNMIQKTKADESDNYFGYLVKELGQVITEIVDGVETKSYSLEGYTTSWVSTGNLTPTEGAVTGELSAETAQVVVFTNCVVVEEEPEVTDPEPTEPEVTDPEPTEPEVTDPEPTEPEVTQPTVVTTGFRLARDGGEVEELPDEEVPLADAPKTGDATPVLAALIVLAGFGLIVLNIFDKKRKLTDF